MAVGRPWCEVGRVCRYALGRAGTRWGGPVEGGVAADPGGEVGAGQVRAGEAGVGSVRAQVELPVG
jgi:hypothetical protein